MEGSIANRYSNMAVSPSALAMALLVFIVAIIMMATFDAANEIESVKSELKNNNPHAFMENKNLFMGVLENKVLYAYFYDRTQMVLSSNKQATDQVIKQLASRKVNYTSRVSDGLFIVMWKGDIFLPKIISYDSR